MVGADARPVGEVPVRGVAGGPGYRAGDRRVQALCGMVRAVRLVGAVVVT